MGVLQRVRDWLNAADLIDAELSQRLEAGTVTVGGGDVVQVAHLPQEVAQAFGIFADSEAVTRKQALGLSTVAQGRDTIAGTIGTFELIATRRGGSEPAPRAFLEQPDKQTTAQWTLTWTVDDLMFYGIAWWYVRELDAQRFPADAMRVAPGRVSWDADGTMKIDGDEVDPARLIRFDGHHEGILRRNPRALKTALLLEAAAGKYATAETPSQLLKDTRPANVGKDLTDDEITALLTKWREQRKLYSTAYLNRALELVTPTMWNPRDMQLVEARQHSALELARMMGLDAHAVNAPAATGMTYNNGQELRRGRLDGPLRPYMTAIRSRLSMPDVTPRGHVVTFDTAAWLLGDAQERVTTAVAASGGPVMTTDEARATYLGMPPNPALNTRQETADATP